MLDLDVQTSRRSCSLVLCRFSRCCQPQYTLLVLSSSATTPQFVTEVSLVEQACVWVKWAVLSTCGQAKCCLLGAACLER